MTLRSVACLSVMPYLATARLLARLAGAALVTSVFVACGADARLPISAGTGPQPQLPAPRTSALPTVHIAPAIGWGSEATPTAAPGTTVAAFQRGLEHPRWLYVLPNGDVLVAESNAPARDRPSSSVRDWVMGLFKAAAGAAPASPNRIRLLRDADGDGVAELNTVLLDQLNSPFGMVLVGSDLYVANTDAIVRFPYTAGVTRITAAGTRLLELPAGAINHHWTKNLIASADGERLYVTIGSNSNVAERGMALEEGRAAIWEVDRRSGQHRVFASGLRNPNGLAWVGPGATLWTVVNERDELGGDLVPDYMTSVRDGGFYGWPYAYFGQHVDPRVKPTAPERVARSLVPDYALGPHTAPLGLAYATGEQTLGPFGSGMFIGQHGSWNRRPRSGYKVIFVPFANGKPLDATPVDVLTAFLSPRGEAYGRPVGVALQANGALLVADDVGDTIWRVSSAR